MVVGRHGLSETRTRSASLKSQGHALRRARLVAWSGVAYTLGLTVRTDDSPCTGQERACRPVHRAQA